MKQGQGCEIRQGSSKMPEQEGHETLQSQQESREVVFACHISWTLIPAPPLGPEGSRTAGDVSPVGTVTQQPGAAPRSCQAFPAHQEQLHIGTTGQTGTGAHDPPTLASESRFAGSAGMLSSTVLVSTATTPTGIPPSLQTGETHTIPTPAVTW